MKYFLVFCLLVLGSPVFGREECTEHEKFVQMLEERGETVTMTTQVLFAMQIPTVTKMIYDLKLEVDGMMKDWRAYVTDQRNYVTIGYEGCAVYNVPVSDGIVKQLVGVKS